MNVDGIGAIVVGGAHGLGAMIARALGDAGADVSIFDIDGAKAAEVAAVFGGYSQHCDLRDETVVAACVTSAMSRFGQAMAQLEKILASREASYAKSDYTLDTSKRSLETSCKDLLHIIKTSHLIPAQANP